MVFPFRPISIVVWLALFTFLWVGAGALIVLYPAAQRLSVRAFWRMPIFALPVAFTLAPVFSMGSIAFLICPATMFLLDEFIKDWSVAALLADVECKRALLSIGKTWMIASVMISIVYTFVKMARQRRANRI